MSFQRVNNFNVFLMPIVVIGGKNVPMDFVREGNVLIILIANMLGMYVILQMVYVRLEQLQPMLAQLVK